MAISATGPQLQTVTITDTVGRQAVKVSSFASTGGDTVSVPGLSSYTVSWGTTSANMPAPNQVQEVSDPYCDVIGGWQAQFLFT